MTGRRTSDAVTLLSPQAARLARIERTLRGRRTVTIKDLLADCRCSRATLKRDLALLRTEFGARIDWDADRGYQLRGEWQGVVPQVARQLAAIVSPEPTSQDG